MINTCKYEFKQYSSDGYIRIAKLAQKWQYTAIKTARQYRGLTCIELSIKAGIAPHIIPVLELGNYLIPDYVIEKISVATNFPLSFFEQEFKPIEWISGHKSLADSIKAHNKLTKL